MCHGCFGVPGEGGGAHQFLLAEGTFRWVGLLVLCCPAACLVASWEWLGGGALAALTGGGWDAGLCPWQLHVCGLMVHSTPPTHPFRVCMFVF